MIPVRPLALSFLAILVGCVPGTASRAQSAGSADELVTLSFYHAPWSAAVLGRETAGLLGWIEGPDGSLRLELGHDHKADSSDHLLDRTGEGWTVILGPDDEGTVNGWGREWRQVDPGLGQLVRAAVAFLSAPGGGTDSRRIQIPDLLPRGNRPASQGSFRRDLVRRGRGRGGSGEIVVLVRHTLEKSGGWVYEIRSTRRPGKVQVGLLEARDLECPVPEVFLPLWPISEMTTRTGENHGTSSTGEG